MAIGVVIDILLFPALSIYLKSRAPGAKTYPQVKLRLIVTLTFGIFKLFIAGETVQFSKKQSMQFHPSLYILRFVPYMTGLRRSPIVNHYT